MNPSRQKRTRRKAKPMIRSMTGFGRGVEKCPYGNVTVEIKTLNHKSLDIICNPFNGLFLLEQKMQGVFAKKVFRGKVYVKVTLERSPGQKKKLQKIEVDESLALEALKKIRNIQKKLGIKGDIEIRELIKLPGVLENTNDKEAEKGLWPHIKKALEEALDQLISYREREGARLARDFNSRLTTISRDMNRIKKCGKQSVDAYRKKLTGSIRNLAKKAEPDAAKLETEVALFVRSCDIAEEVTRMEGHIEEYRNAMVKVRTDAGKKLDFIAQEMQREANTIGAKSSDLGVAKAVIEIKSEIEKIREQSKNIE